MTGTVLVVDDEREVRDSLRRLLEKEGYSVLMAESGQEALEVLEHGDVQVILSDYNMPGISGVDLLKIVRVRHPRVVRIMLTAEQDPELPVRSINEVELYRFVRKPWNNADVRTVVSFAFQVARLEQEKRHLVTLMRNRIAPGEDPAGVEEEILKLAETEASGE